MNYWNEQHFLRDHRRIFARGQLLQHDRELITADARDGVAFANSSFEPHRDEFQQGVARRVS